MRSCYYTGFASLHGSACVCDLHADQRTGQKKKKKKGQHPQSSLALHQDFCPPDFFHYNGRLLNKHDEHSCLVHKSPLYPEKEAIIKV